MNTGDGGVAVVWKIEKMYKSETETQKKSVGMSQLDGKGGSSCNIKAQDIH